MWWMEKIPLLRSAKKHSSVSRVVSSPHNPLGVKGVGEMGTIASTPTIANAVMDALAPLGVRHLDMPLTPEKIWRAINQAKA